MNRIQFIKRSALLLGSAVYTQRAHARSRSPLLDRYKAEMILIPAGTFKMGDDMGSKEEKPAHDVSLSAYRIGKTPVTVEMYQEFCTATKREMPDAPKFNEKWEEKDHPIVNVSWKDAKVYCDWAKGTLTTEAQWEKAARGTDGRKYPWGNEEPNKNRGWFPNLGASTLDIDAGTASVGKFPSGASSYGCLDMAGNVWQWCADYYGPDYYKDSPHDDPTGASFAKERVQRGGSWNLSYTGYFCCAYRGRGTPTERGSGFRLSSP